MLKTLIIAVLITLSAQANACLDYSDAWLWGIKGNSWDDLIGDPCSGISEKDLYFKWDEAFGLGLDYD